jgi:hypothetical protein
VLKVRKNCPGKVLERYGTIKMAGRTKSESLTVIPDGTPQIPHLSQLFKAIQNGVSEVMERRGTMWVVRWTKSEGLTEVHNGLL